MWLIAQISGLLGCSLLLSFLSTGRAKESISLDFGLEHLLSHSLQVRFYAAQSLILVLHGGVVCFAEIAYPLVNI